MKLVDLLAKELREWPSGAKCMTQNSDASAVMLKSLDVIYRNEIWVGADGVSIVGFRNLSELAADHATAIVTRADWEAEKARIAGKVDGGWKRHKGVKQPVADGVKVEIRTRGGDFEVCSADGFAWGATGNSQIMAYRIHKPAEQPAPVSEEVIQVGIDAADAGKLTPIAEVKARIPSLKTERALKGAREGNTAKFSSIDELMQDLGEPMPQPLAWRDRIRTLDTQRAELEATYQRQIGEIDGEREGLVGRLADEGFSLIEQINAGLADAKQAHEGMDDWRNWKEGDLVEYIGDNDSPYYIAGVRYPVECVSQECFYLDDEDNGHHQWSHAREFKFHSRPAR